MEINSMKGYSPLGATSTAYSEYKTAENTKPQIDTSSLCGKEVEVKTNPQQDKSKQQNGDNTSKENAENHLKSVFSVANQKIRMTNTRCEFEYHDKTNRVSIKVIDKDTDEVVREIPPEETLEMVEKIWELAGLIVDERR